MNQLFFLHNPKAAGSSLIELLSALYPPARVCPLIENNKADHDQNRGDYSRFKGFDLYVGHYGADIFRAVRDAHVPITSFRHPADRLFSLFRFWRDLNLPLTELAVDRNEPVALARAQSFTEFALSDHPALRVHNENYHFRQLSNSGWDLGITRSMADVVAFIDTMPWFLVVEHMDLSMRWAKDVFGWDPSSMPMTNARPHANSKEIAELESIREEIVKRNALDYELYLRATDLLQSRAVPGESLPQPAAGTLSYPSIDGVAYRFELRASDVLWVVLRDSAVPEERFTENRLAADLPGCVLEARAHGDRFNQRMIDDLAKRVNRIVKDRAIERVIYIGFSGGADAALLMTRKSRHARRVLAFAPQLEPTQKVVDEINASTVRCDIFLGVHDYYDGAIIAKSFEIENTMVKTHYLRLGHSVDFELDRNGSLRAMLSSAYADTDVEFPEGVRAGHHEATLSVRVHNLARELESGAKVDVPDDEEGALLNPQWWNVKSRIRASNGDVPGAIGDIVRAIILDPEAESHYVCAGNYFRAAGLRELAEASYKRAAEANRDVWHPVILLARLYLESGLSREANEALVVAISRGAPHDSTSSIASQIAAADRTEDAPILAHGS